MALEEFRVRFGRLVTEIIGTAAYVIVIQLSIGSTAITLGLVTTALVFAGGPISGGNYNPAVSLAFFLRGKTTWASLLLYWVFQMIGAFGGALLGAMIGGRTTVPAKGADYYLLQAFLAELVFTALLAFTYLATMTNSNVANNSYYGLAIGLVILVGNYCTARISGAVFNPAVAVSLSIVHGIGKIAYMLWIVLAQAAGGFCGALLYYIVAPDEFPHFNEEAHEQIQAARNFGYATIGRRSESS